MTTVYAATLQGVGANAAVATVSDRNSIGGTFALSVVPLWHGAADAEATPPLPFDASAEEVRAALEVRSKQQFAQISDCTE